MNATFFTTTIALLLSYCGPLSAQVRSSANYAITTDVVDSGGALVTSAAYRISSSAGTIVGSPSVSAAYVSKPGFFGQIYDVVGLSLGAPQSFINEGATLQLSAGQLLDDTTTLALNSSSVTWSVQSGPLSSINSNGLATAQIVYQDMGATAKGTYQTLSGTLNLTVRNVGIDDFGIYAGDGIDDAWQVQYFGVGNPNAGPGIDADGTGQSNLFKYVAGLNPLDPSSRFTVTSQTVAGQPQQRAIIFQPIVTGRVYVVQYNTSIAQGGGTWVTLTNMSSIDNGNIRTVTDLSATDPERFYRIQISKP